MPTSIHFKRKNVIQRHAERLVTQSEIVTAAHVFTPFRPTNDIISLRLI
jgi:hypothetical protein